MSMHLKALRTKANLTQSQLAEKMNATQQTVARWESGKTALNAAHIKQLCGILKCTAQELLGWSLTGLEQDFNRGDLPDVGIPFGTMKLGMSFGAVDVPIGDVGKNDVDTFMERRSILHYQKHSAEWLIVSTLQKRLLFVNFGSVRTVGLVSDEIEAMPAFEDTHSATGFADEELHSDRDEEFCVTFANGSVVRFWLTQKVADALSILLIAGDMPSNSVLLVEDEEAGLRRTYFNLNEVALIDVPTELFAALTSDTETPVEGYD